MEVRFVEVSANDRVIRDRLRQREMRAGEVSDARLEDFEAFKARYEPPTELPRECLVHLRRVDSADEVMGRLLDVFAKGAARRGT
jgi:predicted kinase